ncbi:MAG: tRNA (adenosine(37)-N6)-threonylcarbamoyltransferase complex dimerization subunit type 1 TsaB [Cyclobacteriaceae bacterium]
MSLILSIETSTDVCSVAVHNESNLIAFQRYDLAKSHSSLLAVLIQQMLENADLKISDLSAIAVSAGPGSYTGLRIGVSTVKGIAFGQNLPVIALDSLDVLNAAFHRFQKEDEYAMPMMDARRMEVYCQIRDKAGAYVLKSKALIVEPDSLTLYNNKPIVIFGNGAEKTLPIIGGENITYLPGIVPEAVNMGLIAFQKFQKKEFVDAAYFEPYYLKEYRTIPPKQKF